MSESFHATSNNDDASMSSFPHGSYSISSSDIGGEVTKDRKDSRKLFDFPVDQDHEGSEEYVIVSSFTTEEEIIADGLCGNSELEGASESLGRSN